MVVVLSLTRIKINQVRGHRTGSSHPGAEECPKEKTQTNQRWHTHVSQLTQFMLPPETYKSEVVSQPTTCKVHTGAYVSLLAPGQNDSYTAFHPRKSTTYILHVVPITTHTHERRKSFGKKKRSKKKEDKGIERKGNNKQGSKKNRVVFLWCSVTIF